MYTTSRTAGMMFTYISIDTFSLMAKDTIGVLDGGKHHFGGGL